MIISNVISIFLAMDKILDRLSVLEGRTIRQNGGGKVDDDDDFNLFGSDDEKETPSRNVQKCIGKKKSVFCIVANFASYTWYK